MSTSGQQEETIHIERLKSTLQNITIILAILSAFIPLFAVMGYYYEFGWLSAFGVDSSLIDISINYLLLNFYDMLTGVWGYEDRLLFLYNIY